MSSATARLALALVVAAAVAPAAARAAAPAIGFDKPVYVDQELAGGEPILFADNLHGTLVYTAHEGTTHLYRVGFTAPLGDANFAGNYRNQVLIWTSKDGGTTWQRVDFSQSGFRTDPTKNTGFSDPDLTQDEGGRLYNTGIDLANDAIFSSKDGGLTWDKGNANCHNGDRPWLAGAKPDEAFMASNTLEQGQTIYRTPDGGDSCEADGITDTGDTRHGYGKLYYDHAHETLLEPELYFTGTDQNEVKAIGVATAKRGDKEFTPHFIANTSLFGHFPSIALDAADNIYLVWDTNEREPGSVGGCGGEETPLPNKIQMAVSKDGGNTWSMRTIASPSNTRVMWPWAVAGDDGRVSVVWYEADKVVDPDCAGDAKFSVREAQIFDATNMQAPITVVDPVGRPITEGGVCQGGTTCVATGQDRRLGDYFTVALDQRGCVAIATGDTMMKDPATGGELPTSRPLFVRQNSGPPLYTGTGTGDCSGSRGAVAGTKTSVVPVGGPTCRDISSPISRYRRHQPRFRRGKPNTIHGVAHDRGCQGVVSRVQVSFAQRVGPKHTQCRFLHRGGKFGRRVSCRRHVWLNARGTNTWSLKLPGLARGYYKVWVRGVDKKKHVEHVSRHNIRTFRVTS